MHASRFGSNQSAQQRAWLKSTKRDVRSTFKLLLASWVDPFLEREVQTPARCLSGISATRSVVYIRLWVVLFSNCPTGLLIKQVSEKELKDFFADFGPVKYCQIVKDHNKKWSRGYICIHHRRGGVFKQKRGCNTVIIFSSSNTRRLHFMALVLSLEYTLVTNTVKRCLVLRSWTYQPWLETPFHSELKDHHKDGATQISPPFCLALYLLVHILCTDAWCMCGSRIGFVTFKNVKAVENAMSAPEDQLILDGRYKM